MKTKPLIIIAATLCSLTAQAQELLEGDEKDACEALLCLSSGQRPTECTPPIQRYLSIKMKTPEKTADARRDFLNLCPAAHEDSKMGSLVNAIVNGAGHCDANALNMENTSVVIAMVCASADPESCSQQEITIINPTKPYYCDIYETHEYTYLVGSNAVYVGDPMKGGHWVTGNGY